MELRFALRHVREDTVIPPPPVEEVTEFPGVYFLYGVEDVCHRRILLNISGPLLPEDGHLVAEMATLGSLPDSLNMWDKDVLMNFNANAKRDNGRHPKSIWSRLEQCERTLSHHIEFSLVSSRLS
ncbi:uncharacterized protein P174DRAFT_416232 [Aspergillus novofumigatus IBT 16806]|uniref:Uncharacterized protein n=1 Tax=Aspergillus novofumigatus (strain IBT 16806) TaxID=1392255 RepID=A0A2I1CLJ0_ASPN1|nr:uncharacterized protein P174DRAFT_416232 [Aspergillus novofumigatus IBT 16806]PKX98497.1 hypothetical protein P174DRAFT_416232 [Aspergillus novofumigatus IBT 16806]